MGRIGRGMSMARASWDVVRDDRRLLVLPLLSALASVLAVVAILGPAFVLVHNSDSSTPIYPALAVELYALTFIGGYFGVAFAAMVSAHLDGRRATLGDGLAAANSRASAIGWWTFIAGTVGLLIRALQQLPGVGGLVEAIVANTLGFVWGAATFFVIPVLALERRGAKDAIARSAHVVRERWGESATGFVSITAAFVILMVPLFLCVTFVSAAFAHSAPGVVAVVMVFVIIAMLALALLQAALQQVFRVVLYRYAATGQVPQGFDAAALEQAARPRRRGLFRR